MNLPAPLMTSDSGSYAQYTIIHRKPLILKQVINENNYPSDIIASIIDLSDEIANQTIRPISGNFHDEETWNQALTTYLGKTWLEIPWYFAETLFYRKLLSAVQYYQPGKWHLHNPFQAQKEKLMSEDCKRLSLEYKDFESLPSESKFDALFHAALWGNRADLSNFSVTELGRGSLYGCEDSGSILIDHTQHVRNFLKSGVEQVDFINDNAGADILFDLVLSEFLLSNGWVKKVIFHLKNQPFFVSDAMVPDIFYLFGQLLADPEIRVKTLGEKISNLIESNKLELKQDPFWTSHMMFDQMPHNLITSLHETNLIILKGDVNYRRLLSDLHWPHTKKLEDLTAFFPNPFVTLRTLKSELIVGLEPGVSEAITSEDPSWLINGKRGLIHFINHEHNKPF